MNEQPFQTDLHCAADIQSDTGFSHNTPTPHPRLPRHTPALRGGLAARKGNEDTAPSVLYVVRLELCSGGAGWGPGCVGRVGGAGRWGWVVSAMFQHGNKEPLHVKRGKSNAVITLAAHSQLGGNSLLIGFCTEVLFFFKEKCLKKN